MSIPTPMHPPPVTHCPLHELVIIIPNGLENLALRDHSGILSVTSRKLSKFIESSQTGLGGKGP